jgi:UDP-GlcNAc:undecaprenyl-phosphate GlcNAc-1-phosphate transferase
MAAGNQHLHHRLVKAGVSKRLTVLFIYALTLWVGSLAMAVSGMPAGGTYATISTILMTYACWQVWKRIRANEARSLQESLKEQSSKLNDQLNDQ